MQPSVDDELAGTEKPNRLLARTWSNSYAECSRKSTGLRGISWRVLV